jgi:diacylglycerol kinase
MALKYRKKRTFIDSFKDCINGLSFIMISEHNFKREIILGIFALTASYFLKVSKIEFIIILIMIALVIVCEIFNTAIEKVVDLYTREYNEIARIAKDVSAFAVLTMCMFALVIGIIIFVPKIIVLIGR